MSQTEHHGAFVHIPAFNINPNSTLLTEVFYDYQQFRQAYTGIADPPSKMSWCFHIYVSSPLIII
jgi:hypothetical protein